MGKLWPPQWLGYPLLVMGAVSVIAVGFSWADKGYLSDNDIVTWLGGMVLGLAGAAIHVRGKP